MFSARQGEGAMGQESQAEGHAEGLAQLKARFPEEDPRILKGFLYVKDHNVEEAIAHYEVGTSLGPDRDGRL